MLRRIICFLGCCTRCETYQTQMGIGGRCIDCGKVHGWVTSEELRRYGAYDFTDMQKEATKHLMGSGIVDQSRKAKP